MPCNSYKYFWICWSYLGRCGCHSQHSGSFVWPQLPSSWNGKKTCEGKHRARTAVLRECDWMYNGKLNMEQSNKYSETKQRGSKHIKQATATYVLKLCVALLRCQQQVNGSCKVRKSVKGSCGLTLGRDECWRWSVVAAAPTPGCLWLESWACRCQRVRHHQARWAESRGWAAATREERS